jgi:hypothetical protein
VACRCVYVEGVQGRQVGLGGIGNRFENGVAVVG